MMGVVLVALGHDCGSALARPERGLAGGQPGAVRHPEGMGVDGDGGLAEGDIEHDIGGLAADPGSVSSPSRVLGTLPPCSAISLRDSAIRFLALLR